MDWMAKEFFELCSSFSLHDALFLFSFPSVRENKKLLEMENACAYYLCPPGKNFAFVVEEMTFILEVIVDALRVN